MKTKLTVFLCITIFAALLSLSAAIKSADATYSQGDTIIINSDGSVTPSSAPVVRDGNTYTLTDDVLMPSSTNEGIIVEADNIVLNGAGHTVQGHGDSDAIYLDTRTNVTVQNFLLEDFYWGLTLIDCTKCTIYGNNLSAAMYSLYLSDSSNNMIYHNNIFGRLYYQNSSNTWSNGYPSGGNYWEGYPYADEKSGSGQNQAGSDGIGDTPVGEEIFNQGGNNIDNYPLMTPITVSNSNPGPSASTSASPHASPSASASVNPTPTSSPTITPSPSIPEFPTAILLALIVSSIAGALLYRGKQSKA